MTSIKTPAAQAPDQQQEPRSIWSRTTLVLSAVLVGVIVLAALWLIIDDPDSVRPSEPPVAGAVPVPPGGGAGCGPDGTGSQVPPSTAPDTTWQLIGSMAAPVVENVGPGRFTGGGVPQCFSPDPTGALLAAASFIAANTDPELRTTVLDYMVVDGIGLEAARMEIALRGTGPGGVGLQIAGFTFLSYSEAESAVVDLALTMEGVLLHVPVELAWTDGAWGFSDWRIVLPDTGRAFDSMQPLPSLAGYVPWQGA